MIEQNSAESALRMVIVGGGCSGFQYQLMLEEAPAEHDLVFTTNGVKMFIDPQSAPYLVGVEIDYVNGLAESGFKIRNHWAEYDQALRDRGDITLWISQDAIDAWTPPQTGKRGA